MIPFDTIKQIIWHLKSFTFRQYSAILFLMSNWIVEYTHSPYVYIYLHIYYFTYSCGILQISTVSSGQNRLPQPPFLTYQTLLPVSRSFLLFQPTGSGEGCPYASENGIKWNLGCLLGPHPKNYKTTLLKTGNYLGPQVTVMLVTVSYPTS